MRAMHFVAIETSTEWCSLALWREGTVYGLEQHAGVRHGELVLPMLDELLKRAGVAMNALDAVVFGAGPGAFTGLRVACGIAQGLAFARGLPVLGISTLEATAEESGASRVLVALDARMNEVYCAALEKVDGRWLERVQARCVPPESVEPPPGEGWLAAGSGFGVHAARLLPRLEGRLLRVSPDIRPGAMAMARLAAPRLAAGEGVDAAQAMPVYIRDKVALTSAERAVSAAASPVVQP